MGGDLGEECPEEEEEGLCECGECLGEWEEGRG